jgi:hypothetical protein
MDGSSLNTLLSSPLVLPASIAGVLAALFLLLLVLALRRAGAGAPRLLLPVIAVLLGGLATIAVLDRMAQDQRATERLALTQRDAALTAKALAPGSMLGCLDKTAGDAVQTACEKAVFATPQSAASAVAYVGARLTLLADAIAFAHRDDPGFADRFAPLRRSIELDRFGIVAHVLTDRDGCTPEDCPVFALLDDPRALQANLRVHVFDEYVGRYAAAWEQAPAAGTQAPVASVVPVVPAAPAAARPTGLATPVPSKYDFPSAASIPPVSIMNAEPPRPPAGAEEAADPAAPPVATPVPPKRPLPLAPQR